MHNLHNKLLITLLSWIAITSMTVLKLAVKFFISVTKRSSKDIYEEGGGGRNL